LQIRALREYAAQRGWAIAMQVKEVGSGVAQRQLREKLPDAARRREIEVVLVWRLDRWGRSVAVERHGVNDKPQNAFYNCGLGTCPTRIPQ
jgi:DNA invertase Pin-like site-specific DNA recombinase